MTLNQSSDMKLKVNESKDRLKRSVCPFLEVVFEKFFDSHL